jgi:hypothetical protein
MTVSLTPALSPRARGIRSALRTTFTVTMLSDMGARERRFAAKRSAFWRLDMDPQPVLMDRPPRGQPA